MQKLHLKVEVRSRFTGSRNLAREGDQDSALDLLDQVVQIRKEWLWQSALVTHSGVAK
jgi:hypothetical protein